MSLSHTNATPTETEMVRREKDALKDRLTRLREVSINISECLDTEAALQDVINSTSNLTCARYGVLVIFQPSGSDREVYTYGLSQEERDRMTQSPQGLCHSRYTSRETGPIRLKDVATLPDTLGLQESHPPIATLLGMPLQHRSEHLGNLYLIGKEAEQEFTQEDEDAVAMIAAQAAAVISSSQRHEAERQAKVDLESLMEICPVGVSVFDVRLGAISYMNKECRRLLHEVAPSNDDIEKLFEYLKFTWPDGRELSFVELPGTRALQSGEPTIAEEIVIHLPSGTKIPTLVNCAPIFSESGETLSVLTAIQDITPLEEQELRRAEFLGRVSEELRMPLTTIKGSVVALKGIAEAMQPTEALQLLRIVDQQSDLMRSQINSLIELTQIETGTLSVVSEPVDVAKLVETSCREYLRDHAAITIKLDIVKELAPVLADRERISKVLHNFLRRAAKYSSESTQITVAASMIDFYVAISVSVEMRHSPTERTSFAIDETEHAHMLEKASLAHTKAVESASQGEGLAMAFCRGVVEAHGGRIRTHIDDQQGRLFLTFTLPTVEEGILSTDTKKVVDEPLPAPSGRTQMLVGPEDSTWKTAEDPLPAHLERTQILVSIEEPRLLGTVRRVLSNAGYGPVTAADLRDVEELASSETAKLILLDIAGREEECFRTLQRARISLRLPAIVFCDRDDEHYVVRAFEMGADGYMVKPFSPSELIARIKATLRRWAGNSELADSTPFKLGDMLINFDERSVYVSGQPIQLTAKEYNLLTELSNSAGRVLLHDILLHRVWGPEYSGDPQLLRSHIKSLRHKLGDNARHPTYILTEHGVGYRMAKPAPMDLSF